MHSISMHSSFSICLVFWTANRFAHISCQGLQYDEQHESLPHGDALGVQEWHLQLQCQKFISSLASIQRRIVAAHHKDELDYKFSASQLEASLLAAH
jgi:hypothetical protein